MRVSSVSSVQSKPRRKLKSEDFGYGFRLLADGSVPERVIQAQVLRWLAKTGILCWRANSGVVHVKGRRILLGPEGISDLVVVVPPSGRFVGMEIKSANGRLRPAQDVFRKKVEEMGGVYVVVRSLEEAKNAVAGVMGGQKWKLN